MEYRMTEEQLKELIFEQLRADIAAEIMEDNNGGEIAFLGDICLHGSANLEIVVRTLGFNISDDEDDPIATKLYDAYVEQVLEEEFESKLEAMNCINKYYSWLLKELEKAKLN